MPSAGLSKLARGKIEQRDRRRARRFLILRSRAASRESKGTARSCPPQSALSHFGNSAQLVARRNYWNGPTLPKSPPGLADFRARPLGRIPFRRRRYGPNDLHGRADRHDRNRGRGRNGGNRCGRQTGTLSRTAKNRSRPKTRKAATTTRPKAQPSPGPNHSSNRAPSRRMEHMSPDSQRQGLQEGYNPAAR